MLSGWSSSWAPIADDEEQIDEQHNDAEKSDDCDYHQNNPQNPYALFDNDASADAGIGDLILKNERRLSRQEEDQATAGASRPDLVAEDAAEIPAPTKRKGKHNRKRTRNRHRNRYNPTPVPLLLNVFLVWNRVIDERSSSPNIALMIEGFPHAALVSVSRLVREQLHGVPQYSYGGSNLEHELYIDADKVDEDELRTVLYYIDDYWYSPHYNSDPSFAGTRPEIPFPTTSSTDVKKLCNLYSVYIYLGMEDGLLSQQATLIKEITTYFRTDQYVIDADEVLYFWRACKDDANLTWRVMLQVLAWISSCDKSIDQAFAKTFEIEPELRFLWETRGGKKMVMPDPEAWHVEERKWRATVASWENFYGYEIDD